jgi:hypothetical protein
VDTGLFRFEESTMGKTRAAYPPEFCRQMLAAIDIGDAKFICSQHRTEHVSLSLADPRSVPLEENSSTV